MNPPAPPPKDPVELAEQVALANEVLEEVIFEERAEKSLSTPPLPDLSLTERALARYDAEEPRLSKLIDAATTTAEVTDLLTKLEQLEEAVGAAFGDDTSDRNNPETCRKVIRPGPAIPPPGSELSFVRRMVAKWKGA